jgi:hypothetical protein
VPKIEDLLQRRTDLSTFLVHFTRTQDGRTSRQRLLNMLVEERLHTGRPLGMASEQAVALQDQQVSFFRSQQVVCFTETPLEHAWMMVEDIEGRAVAFGSYGLAFTKTWGRSQGINPVWYLDISARSIDWLTKPVNRMVEAAIQAANYDHDIFKLTPYVEQMGPTKVGRKEFWWEREWRLAGRDLLFRASDVVAALAPANQHTLLAAELEVLRQQQSIAPNYFANLRFIDPRWGLERIIARLAGVPDNVAGPFPH